MSTTQSLPWMDCGWRWSTEGRRREREVQAATAEGLPDDHPPAPLEGPRCQGSGATGRTAGEKQGLARTLGYRTAEEGLTLSVLRPAEWRFELRLGSDFGPDAVVLVARLHEEEARAADEWKSGCPLQCRALLPECALAD